MRTLISIMALLALSSTAYAETATLKWNANTESDLAGYHVYAGSASDDYGEPVDVGMTDVPTSPTFTITLPDVGCGEDRTFFFVVTAYDVSGNESAKSNESSKTFDVAPCSPILEQILSKLETIEELMKTVQITFGASE